MTSFWLDHGLETASEVMDCTCYLLLRELADHLALGIEIHDENMSECLMRFCFIVSKQSTKCYYLFKKKKNEAII